LHDQCLTLSLKNVPTLLTHSLLVNFSQVAEVVLKNAANEFIATPFANMTISVTLVKESNGFVAASMEIKHTGGVWMLPMFQPIFDRSGPANDFKWRLKLVNPVIIDYSFSEIQDEVSILDVKPVVKVIDPAQVDATGAAVVLDSQPGPSFEFFLPLFTAKNITNNSCDFKPMKASGFEFSVPATVLLASRTNIRILCSSFSSGMLKPIFSNWTIELTFADGRKSVALDESASLTSYCPTGMYIHHISDSFCYAPPCCLACPAPQSTTLSINAGQDGTGTRSCVCSKKFYGPYGEQCKKCPDEALGFDCNTAGQIWPRIKEGYFIDYSMLDSCSETKCDAIVKCPNPNACPGQENRQCVQNDDECYDSDAFGCVKCCKGFYIEESVCYRCPQGQLPVLLALALVALIVFVGFSSTVDFPPALSVVAGIKVFITGMQKFVGIRLFDIPWPSIALKLFDFSRFFSFSIDVIRPECAISYNPDTKLAFLLIGPFACVIIVACLMVAYVTFKSRRIALALQHPTVQPLLAWSFWKTFRSVRSCIIVSALCLKFSSERIMSDGILWNALNPVLTQRSNMLVLNQMVRRNAVNTLNSNVKNKTAHPIPTKWTDFAEVILPLNLLNEFERSIKRVRLLLSSAMSIFFFTFQGNMEAALSSFDCNDGFLRNNPAVKCNFDDSTYVRMLVISASGILIYCIVLPVCVILVLRSRWSREVFLHDNAAYSLLVGFLTSLYQKDYRLWELVSCCLKIVLITIPMLITKNPIVQGLAVFVAMLLYMSVVLYLKPMQSIYLNKLEVLSCISVLVGAFASVFFVAEYNGKLLLSGRAKDFVGLMFVIICAGSFLMSMKFIYSDFMRLLRTHKILFLKSWISEINARLGAAGTEGNYISIVAAFFNKKASAEIFELKRNMRMDLKDFKERLLRRSSLLSVIVVPVRVWMFQIKLAFRAHKYQPSPEDVDECMKSPEFETLVYLHKLSERVVRWEHASEKYWDVKPHELPKEYREVKGDSDPPFSEYTFQTNVIQMLNDALPAGVHRVLESLMFSYFMNSARGNMTPDERLYASPCPD